MVQAMKKLCKSIHSNAEWPWTNPGWISFLPSDPNSLDPLWRHEANAQELPMHPPPIGLEAVQARSGSIPMRKSHRDIASQRSTSSGATPLRMVGTMFKEALQIVASQSQDASTTARITMLASPKRERTVPQAIMDAPARDVKEEIAGSPDKKLGEAIDTTNRSLLDAFEAEDAVSKPVKQEPVDKTGDTSADAMEGGGAVVDDAQQLSIALQGKPLPQSSKRGRPAVMKRPGTEQGILKRPASKKEDVATASASNNSNGNQHEVARKKPAAKVAVPKKKSITAPMKKPKVVNTNIGNLLDQNGKVKWTGKRRLKEYGEGCSKCRGQPGCTPSCFRYRGQL